MLMRYKATPYILFIFLLCSLASGFSTLSVSKVDFISNDPTIEGNSFLVQGVAGFDGSGYIQATDIKDDQYQATKNLNINIEKEKYSCDYSFSNAYSEYIYTFHISDTKYWTENGCINHDYGPNSVYYAALKPNKLAKYSCIYAKKVYNFGYVTQPVENFELEFALSNGEETLQSGVLSSKTVNQVSFNRYGKRYATVNYQGGGLQTSAFCPLPSSTLQIAIQNMGEQDFSIVPYNQYADYKSRFNQLENTLRIYANDLESFWDSVGGTVFGVDDEIQRILDTVNTEVEAFSPGSFIVGAQGERYYLTNKPDGATKTIDLDRPFTLPLFTIRVNADWVGVVIPVGFPEITDYNPKIVSFKSGLGKVLTINVRNVGDGTGTFTTSATCQDKIDTTKDSVTLTPGQEGQLDIFFNSNYVRDVEEQCKICVFDINNNNNQDCFLIKALSTAILEFEDGMLTCVGDTLKVSQDNTWVTRTVCENGCIQTGEKTAVCREPKDVCESDDQCPSGYICQAGACVSEDSQINIFWVSLILAIIGGGIATFYLTRIIPKRKGLWGTVIFIVATLILLFLLAVLLKSAITTVYNTMKFFRV